MKKFFEDLLNETEKAHAASGHPAEGWAAWYAEFIAKKFADEGILLVKAEGSPG